MARMTTMERGMIIDIDLDPVQGSETGKVRPCVVVTNDVYNARVPVDGNIRSRHTANGVLKQPVCRNSFNVPRQNAEIKALTPYKAPCKTLNLKP